MESDRLVWSEGTIGIGFHPVTKADPDERFIFLCFSKNGGVHYPRFVGRNFVQLDGFIHDAATLGRTEDSLRRGRLEIESSCVR